MRAAAVKVGSKALENAAYLQLLLLLCELYADLDGGARWFRRVAPRLLLLLSAGWCLFGCALSDHGAYRAMSECHFRKTAAAI